MVFYRNTQDNIHIIDSENYKQYTYNKKKHPISYRIQGVFFIKFKLINAVRCQVYF